MSTSANDDSDQICICPCGSSISQLPGTCHRCGDYFVSAFGQTYRFKPGAPPMAVSLQRQPAAPPQVQEHHQDPRKDKYEIDSMKPQAQRSRNFVQGKEREALAATLATCGVTLEEQSTPAGNNCAKESSNKKESPPPKPIDPLHQFRITDGHPIWRWVCAFRRAGESVNDVPLLLLQTQWKVALRRGDAETANDLLLKVAGRMDRDFPLNLNVSKYETINAEVIDKSRRALLTTDCLEIVNHLTDKYPPGLYSRQEIVKICLNDNVCLPTFGMDPDNMEDWLTEVVYYPPSLGRQHSKPHNMSTFWSGRGTGPLLHARTRGPRNTSGMRPMVRPRRSLLSPGDSGYGTFKEVFYVPEKPIPVPSTTKSKEKRKLNAAKKNHRTPQYALATLLNPDQKDITGPDGVERNLTNLQPSTCLTYLTDFKSWLDTSYLPYAKLYVKFLETRLPSAGQGLVLGIKTHPKLLEKNPRLNEQIIEGTVEVLLEQYTAAVNKLLEIYDRFQPVSLRQNRPRDWLLLFHAFKPAMDQAAEEYDETILKIISEIPSEVIEAARSSDAFSAADNAPVCYAEHLDVIFGGLLPGYDTKNEYEMKRLSFPEPFITYARAYASSGHEVAMFRALIEEIRHKRSRIMPTEAK